MAIAKVEYGNNTQGSVTDLVIDISKIQDFIKPGVSPEKIKDAINKRAEEQVDTEPEIQAINNFIRDGKVNFDSVMDAKLLSDKGELRKLLEDYGLAIDDSKKDLVGLASAIDFQLTDTGKIKIPGNTTTTREQAEKFYKDTGTTPEDCVGALNGSQKNTGIEKVTFASRNNSPENQVVGYKGNNVYEGSHAADKENLSRSGAKSILKDIMRGKNDDIDFVAIDDKIGNRVVDLATKNDKQVLKEQFFRPLKKLCLNRDGKAFERSVSENGLDLNAVWKEIVSAYDTSKNKGQDISTEDFWRKQFNVTNLPVTKKGNNERQFGEWMSEVAGLYADYRNDKYSGGYVEKVLGAIDNNMRDNSDNTFDNGRDSVANLYNNNNNRVKEITLEGGRTILDGKSDESKAKGLLEEMGITEAKYKKYGQSAVETYNVKILNDFAIPTDATAEEVFVNFLGDTSFNGKVDNSDMGTRTGLQIQDHFQDAVAEYAYINKIDITDKKSLQNVQNAVVKNIIKYASKQAELTFKPELANALNCVHNASSDSLVGYHLVGKEKFLSKNPETLKYIQNLLIEKPGALDGILLYGELSESTMQAEYKKAKESAEIDRAYNAKIDSAVDSCATLSPSEKVIAKDKMKADAGEIKKLPLTNGMSEQQLLQTVALNVVHALSTDTYVSYFGADLNKIANQIVNDTKLSTGGKAFETKVSGVTLNGAVGMGGSIALDKYRNIRLNYGVATTGATIVPALGISAQQDLGGGRRAGEQVHLIVPGYSQTFTKTFEGKNKTAGDLDTISSKSTTVGIDANISVLGVGAGVGFFRERDILKGIDQGYATRKTEAKSIIAPILDGIDVNTNQATLKTAIKNKLTALYGAQSSPEKITYMVDALHAAMASYGCGQLANIDKTILLDQLSQAFAGEWKNQAVAETKGTKLTGRGMRVGASTNPWENAVNILTLGMSLKLTNFNKGFHYEQTAESIAGLKDAEFGGINNRKLSDTVGSREVALINQKLERSALDNKLPDIEYDAKTNTIRIPQGLWEGKSLLNTKIAPVLKGFVKLENGYLVVPANAPLSFNSFHQGSAVEHILSIGSSKVEEGSLTLITGTTLPSDRQASSLDGVKFEGGSKANNLTKEKVQSFINGMKAKKGFENFNVQVVSADNKKIKLSINGVVQEFDSNKELTVVMKDKILSVVQGSETAGKLSLKFDNQDNTSTTNSNKNDIPLGSLEYHEVDTEKAAMDEINANLSLIEKIENQNDDSAKEGFYQFMDAVQKRDTETAAKYLVKMFDKQPGLKTMVTLLNNGTSAEKEVIVSRMLSVFALEEASYKGKTLQSIMNSRDVTSKNVVPAYQRLGETRMNFVSRDDIKSWFNTKEVTHGSKVDMPNVLGYTAFYRRSIGGNKDHRGYALTTPGYTNSLVPPHDLTGDKRDEAMKWLASEINTDKFAKRAIKDALTNKLKDYGIVSDENVVAIMQGASEIKLGNGTVVKLSTTPVFYFLAECANESIGLRIDSMVVQQGGSDVVINTDLTDTSTIDFSAGGGGFYMNTTEGRGVAAISGARSTQFGAGVALRANGGGGDDGYTRGSSETGGSNQQNHGGGSTNTGGSTNGGGVPGDMPTNP